MMKCVFTVTDRDPTYIEMAKVLVLTAQLNSNVDVCCLYDGQDISFMSWLYNRKVPCIRWQVPFLEEIEMTYTGNKSFDYCAGAYLCIETANAFKANSIDDEYAIYLDADIMVMNNLEFDHKPRYFSAPPDWDVLDWTFVSTGVMVLNLQRLREDYDKFVKHLISHNFDFSFAGHGPCSQGAWNTFYSQKWDNLSPGYDWKPWWGFNPNARLVHFSGPKPNEVLRLINDLESEKGDERDNINRFVIKQNVGSYQKYLQIWKQYHNIVSQEG